jgi:hypothetical protein
LNKTKKSNLAEVCWQCKDSSPRWYYIQKLGREDIIVQVSIVKIPDDQGFMIAISNVTSLLEFSSNEMRKKYANLLTSSLSNETMNPLTSILNMTEMTELTLEKIKEQTKNLLF